MRNFPRQSLGGLCAVVIARGVRCGSWRAWIIGWRLRDFLQRCLSTRRQQRFRYNQLHNAAIFAMLAFGLTCAQADTVRDAAQPIQWNRANIHGHRIYYALRGSGPTLVFLHGGGDSGEHSFVRQLGYSQNIITSSRQIRWARDAQLRYQDH